MFVAFSSWDPVAARGGEIHSIRKWPACCTVTELIFQTAASVETGELTSSLQPGKLLCGVKKQADVTEPLPEVKQRTRGLHMCARQLSIANGITCSEHVVWALWYQKVTHQTLVREREGSSVSIWSKLLTSS